MESKQRTPDLLDCIAARWAEHAARMEAEFEAMIRECREALGMIEDTGERRREFRDSL